MQLSACNEGPENSAPALPCPRRIVVKFHRNSFVSRRKHIGHEGDVTKVTAQVQTNANTCLNTSFFKSTRFQSFRFSNSKRVWVEQLTVKVTLCHPAVYAVCIPMHFGHLLKTMYFIFYLQYIILYQAISFNQGAQNLKKCHKWHNDSCSS